MLVSLCGCVRTEMRALTLSPAQPRPRTIAIAPLCNLTDNDQGAQMVTDALVAELGRRRSAAMVDGSAAVAASYHGPIERSRAQDLGQQLGADAVLYGNL